VILKEFRPDDHIDIAGAYTNLGNVYRPHVVKIMVILAIFTKINVKSRLIVLNGKIDDEI